MHLSQLRFVYELRCPGLESKVFAFRPLPAIALAQARRAGLSGKQKNSFGLSVLCDSAVIFEEGSSYE
jgi:hypothetical protein